mgnify:CR=1 FL=1
MDFRWKDRWEKPITYNLQPITYNLIVSLPPSLPAALLRSLESLPGFDAESFLATHQASEQVSSIRFNPSKSGRNINSLPLRSPVPWCKEGWYLLERPVYTLDPLIHAGHYYVQEASSMFLRHALEHALGEESDPHAQRNIAIVELLYSTGIRVSELCGLDRKSVV